MDFNNYNFFVGTARGSLICLTEKPTNIKCAQTEEAAEVTALSFWNNTEDLIIGHQNGNVRIYNTLENKYLNKVNALEGAKHIVGLDCINNTVIISKYDGIINLWNGKKNNYFDISLDEKGTLNAAVLNKFRENVIGTGGEFNDFKLWNIETSQCIFKAKSLGHDMLNLPIPTSIRSITFLSENEHLSVCCTKEGHVLMYDDRAQRKPVIKFLEKQASYTTITSANMERQCLVGTTRGYIQLLDMKMAKSLKTFTNFTGSVTDIFCDPFEPYVVSTSLDRYLRIHNLETKELLHKIYLKYNLTKLIVKQVVKKEEEEEQNDEKEVEDEEYEEIFRNMETVDDGEFKKQKRKVSDKSQDRKNAKKKKVKKSKIVSVL